MKWFGEMTFKDENIRKNLKRRVMLIEKACGDCWWVKAYVIGNLYYGKGKTKQGD